MTRAKAYLATADIRREREAYKYGFSLELTGKTQPMPIGDGVRRKVFIKGRNVGKIFMTQLGEDKINELLKDATRLQMRARAVHQRACEIARRLDLRDPPRPEPCARCWLIGVCKETGWTCDLFRGYVNQLMGVTMVPDKSWDDSWAQDKD